MSNFYVMRPPADEGSSYLLPTSDKHRKCRNALIGTWVALGLLLFGLAIFLWILYGPKPCKDTLVIVSQPEEKAPLKAELKDVKADLAVKSPAPQAAVANMGEPSGEGKWSGYTSATFANEVNDEFATPYTTSDCPDFDCYNWAKPMTETSYVDSSIRCNRVTEILEAQFATLPKSGAIVMFQAEWCPACQAKKPWLDELSQISVHPVFVVDMAKQEQVQSLAKKYSIEHIPEILFFRDNKEFARYLPQTQQQDTKEALLQWAKNVLVQPTAPTAPVVPAVVAPVAPAKTE
jgi:thiol-disulfide isomerase/thioredoxin